MKREWSVELDLSIFCLGISIGLQKCIGASGNSLCYLFLRARRINQNELIAQYENVTIVCQLHNVILDSFICLNDLNTVNAVWLARNFSSIFWIYL